MQINSCLTALFIFIHCLAFAADDNKYDVAKNKPGHAQRSQYGKAF